MLEEKELLEEHELNSSGNLIRAKFCIWLRPKEYSYTFGITMQMVEANLLSSNSVQ